MIRSRAQRPQSEAERATAALREAAAALEHIATQLREQGRDDDAEIVETGTLMAADPTLASAVSEAVTERGIRASRRPGRGDRRSMPP